MPSEQRASIQGSGNIIIQSSGNLAQITVGAPAPYLTLVPAQIRIKKATERVKSEIDLLSPYYRAIDLVAREADLNGLWQWLHSKRQIAVRTLIGRAGAGKTRLAA